MDSVPDLVKEGRRRAGLTVRALAVRAGVPPSTVTRVEGGQVDPTVGMLRRLVAAAGHDLVLGVTADPHVKPRTVADVATAWRLVGDRGEAAWARLQLLLDFLGERPGEVAGAIARAPQSSGSPAMDAALVGMARRLADDAGLPRPGWTRSAWSVPPGPMGTGAGQWPV